ncbi:MAG: hypothetical protein KC620_17605, partial [Myxococcales bacterium]|nr:hypothetical protein [Myxococcales bacterium]
MGPWLGYYENPIPIRRMGAFFLYRATRDGQPRVVAVSRPELDPLTARTIIRRAVQIHLTVRTAAVPLPAERDAVDDLSFVAFNCDAVCDLAHILDAMGDPLPSRLPIDATSALLHHTADALAALHAARTSQMIAGRLSPA